MTLWWHNFVPRLYEAMALPRREMKYEACEDYSLTLSLISPCNDEIQAWVCSLTIPWPGSCGQWRQEVGYLHGDPACQQYHQYHDNTSTQRDNTDISTAPLLLLPRQNRGAAFNMLSYIQVLCDSFECTTKTWMDDGSWGCIFINADNITYVYVI